MKKLFIVLMILVSTTITASAPEASNPDCRYHPTFEYTFKHNTGDFMPINISITFRFPSNESRDAMLGNNAYWGKSNTLFQGTYDDPDKKLTIYMGQTYVFKTDRCIDKIELYPADHSLPAEYTPGVPNPVCGGISAGEDICTNGKGGSANWLSAEAHAVCASRTYNITKATVGGKKVLCMNEV